MLTREIRTLLEKIAVVSFLLTTFFLDFFPNFFGFLCFV